MPSSPERAPLGAERLYWLALTRLPGIGGRRWKWLLEQFGSAKAIWEASPAALQKTLGIGPGLVKAILRARAEFDALAEEERLWRLGVRVLLLPDPAYPPLLRHLPDPPPTLYVRGAMASFEQPPVAVVGTRQASAVGLRVARQLAQDLARAGLTVVSGLARGIDGAAHRGALEAPDGRTIAVLAGGLDRIYPPEHLALAEEVAARGLLLSEYPPGVEVRGGNFPARNRIISGLCAAVVVVEAGEKSGALITAGFAADQGREVFAVPGDVTRWQTRGTNLLIKDGARVALSAADVLEALAIPCLPNRGGREGENEMSPAGASLPPPVREEAMPGWGRLECEVLNSLQAGFVSPEELADRLQESPAKVLAVLAVLELGGYVRRQMDGSYRINR